MAMTEHMIAQLIEKIANGDKDAESLLFEQFDEKIELIVRARLNHNVSPDDVKDIAADIKAALLEALRNGKFDPSKNCKLSTYIAGITQKQIALYFRKAKRNREFPQDDAHENVDDMPLTLDVLISVEEQKQLRKKLARLNSKYRQVLLLRYYEGKSIDEICNILVLEKKQVIDRLHYSLKKLLKECKNDEFFSIFSILLQILI